MPTMSVVTAQNLTGIVYGVRWQGGCKCKVSQQEVSGAFDYTPPSIFNWGSINLTKEKRGLQRDIFQFINIKNTIS